MQLGTSIRAVALASVGIFAVVACGGNNGAPSLNLAPAAQQILRLNPATEANSFDPTQQTYSYEAAVVGQNFESTLKPKAHLSDVQPPAAVFKWGGTLWVAVPTRKDVVESAAGGTFPSTDTTKAEVWANNANTIVGNGPYKISEIASKDHVTLVPNTNYWGGTAKLQQIILYYISDGNTEFSKYQTGALDIANVPLADVTVVRGDPVLSKQAHLYPQLTTFR